MPAGGGYGGPAGYFLLQAVAVLVERSRFGRAVGLGRGLIGRLFAIVVLALPAYFLFHPPFVRGVILPLMTAIGAA